MKHFELTSGTKEVLNTGIILHRIVSLVDLPHASVKKGDLGGWIASESNIQELAWVGEEAVVYQDAVIGDKAVIKGQAKARGKVVIAGSSLVMGRASVAEKAKVIGESIVGGEAALRGDTVIDLSQFHPLVTDTLVRQGTWLRRPLTFYGTRHTVNVSALEPLEIRVGCQIHLADKWLTSIESILSPYGYSRADIAEYYEYILMIVKFYRLRG